MQVKTTFGWFNNHPFPAVVGAQRAAPYAQVSMALTNQWLRSPGNDPKTAHPYALLPL